MKEKTFKLFWKTNGIHKKVYSIEYPNDKEYYEFIEEQHKKGLEQITVTPELMIELIKNFVIKNNMTINKILLLSEDEDIQKIINYEVTQSEKDITNLTYLIKQIEIYTKETDENIKKICFTGSIKNQKPAIVYIQFNGIFEITSESNKFIKKYITNIIETNL